jgi:DNA-binding transcriptional MerR regulator
MNDRRYSLEDLEAAADVPARQIRELVRLRILPAPSSRGRGATYGTEHLHRLRAWKRLRDDLPRTTTSDQIRRLLNTLSDQGLLRQIADGTIPFSLVDDQTDEVTVVEAPTPYALRESAALSDAPGINDAALQYLRSIRATRQAPTTLTARAPFAKPHLQVNLGAAERSGAQLSLERLFTALDAYASSHAADVRVNQPKSETWHRVTVEGDLEIAARGPLSPDEIQLLETVGQLLQRAIYRKENSNV